MSKCDKNLFYISGVTTIVMIFVKFFIIVALAIPVFYQRNYFLGYTLVALMAVLASLDFVIAHQLKSPKVEAIKFPLLVAISTYLLLFSLILPGIFASIPTLRKLKKNP
ncbi:MAG TPA: hypothetical protein VJZ31_02620 [Bacilli bacterium]|nr:hypothetical protein [Bacilli bacterium]